MLVFWGPGVLTWQRGSQATAKPPAVGCAVCISYSVAGNETARCALRQKGIGTPDDPFLHKGCRLWNEKRGAARLWYAGTARLTRSIHDLLKCGTVESCIHLSKDG